MESRIKRFKFTWRVFMIANLGLGAYIFARARMRGGSSKSEKQENTPVPTVTSAPTGTSASTVELLEEPEIAPSPIADLVRVREPIPEDQQRELFKWILDEKRKVQPRDKNEKKQIDEEKAILKQFIHAKSIPSI